MKNYIALLRGINVSGQKKIIMADLRKYLTDAKLSHVTTYIQSGNILFKYNGNQADAANIIRNTILNKFGFEVPVVIFQSSFLKEVIDQNPFLTDPNIDTKQLYVSFLSEMPNLEQTMVLSEKNIGEDSFFLADKIMYLRYLNGAGRTKLTNNFIETHLKVKATSRNWRTISKLFEKK